MATISIQTFLSNTFASGISGYSGAGGGGSGAGTSGFSGYSGFSGESGFSGISGYSGTGSSGFSGISGFSGAGTSGFSGVSGFSGAGTSGFSGFSGASTSGFSGFSGAGTSGFSGFSGAAGGGSGTQGNIAGLTYQFSTNTAMTDPDQGYVRFNNATAGSVTEIAIDNLTYQGTSVGSYLDTWDDSTSTPKGTLIIKTNSNTDNTYSIFNLSSVTDNAGPATYSISINGDNSNYISAPVSSAFTFGTADFTIEGWIYSNVNNSGRGVFQQATSLFPSSTSNSVALGTNSNATWQLYAKNTNTNSVATFATNTWYHFAVVRSGTTTNLYINGISIITLTNDTTNYTGTYMGIGSIYQSVTYNWNGYISNFRVVKGTAVYTTNFTPPAAPLTAITNTQLLTGQNVTIIDNSTNNFTLTVFGTVTTTTDNPFGAGTGFKTLGVTYVAGSIPINNQIIALQFYATGNSGFSGGAGGGGGASGFSGFSGESGAGTSGYSGISGYSGTGSLQISIVSGTTQTANSNTQYVLTNVGTTTVTLPGSPANGDIVWITVANNLNTNVIARNGNQIMGLSEDMTIDVANVTVRLRYIDSTYMWRLI